MKISMDWLNDYVDTGAYSAQQVAQKLLGCGFEVEAIEYQRDSVKNVKAGKIVSIEKHPHADRLSVCKVDIGDGTVQIVTNATNVFVGAKVAVALDGSTLPDGTKIQTGELRGVVSEGMFTGGDSFKLTEDDYAGAGSAGVLILSDDVKEGTDAADIFGFNDVILDISVTANRPDCNSVIGIAREVSAVMHLDFKEPIFTDLQCKGTTSVGVEVNNQTLCPRYMAQSVSEVKVCKSPLYIRKRLKAVGIRPINNIVDVTNYVLIELGQPMHAFDRKNVGGGKIIVRNATEGEKIVTLDGKENTLNTSMLVIADTDKPMAVAGIMGGEFSGITDDTTDIVFESAKFARDNIRRTSRALNLRSDSSARFEKGIDFASQALALRRAVQLVSENGFGVPAENLVDICVPLAENRVITYPVAALKRILGVRVKADTAAAILNSLGIDTEIDGKLLRSVVPDRREDIETENDIAEEVIRMLGYGKVKSTLLAAAEQTIGGWGTVFENVARIRSALVSAGAHEIVTYSFVSPKCFELLKLPADDYRRNAVKIRNPLGEDVSIMRTTLVSSMMEIIVKNISNFNKSGVFFEIAKTYTPKQQPLTELPQETETLCLGAYGAGTDFFALKGILQRLSIACNFQLKYMASKYPFLHDGRSARLTVNNLDVGYIGEIHPDVLENYGVDNRVYVAELNVSALQQFMNTQRSFKGFSKLPPVTRDLAVVVKADVTADQLVTLAQKQAAHLESAAVFDVYTGSGIKKGYKSVALNLVFRNNERTMTDAEIDAEMHAILEAMQKRYKAVLR